MPGKTLRLLTMVATLALVAPAPLGAASTRSADNLLYHDGQVMLRSVNYAILWEPPTLQDGTRTKVTAGYNALIKRYFRDVGGSGLYNNNIQYYEVSYGQKRYIRNQAIFGGAWLDTSLYPPSGCEDSYTPGNCVSYEQLQEEVARAMKVNGWTGGRSHMFFVFTSDGEGSCVTRRLIPGCSFLRYCAWHNYFHANGRVVIYANQPYPGTNMDMCGVPVSPNNDRIADSNLNLVSHEQMEAVTDFSYKAWWVGDANTGEIADICGVFNFGSLDEDGGKANQKWNDHFYILQEEWSNKRSGCVQDGP